MVDIHALSIKGVSLNSFAGYALNSNCIITDGFVTNRVDSKLFLNTWEHIKPVNLRGCPPACLLHSGWDASCMMTIEIDYFFVIILLV